MMGRTVISPRQEANKKKRKSHRAENSCLRSKLNVERWALGVCFLQLILSFELIEFIDIGRSIVPVNSDDEGEADSGFGGGDGDGKDRD
jgi:hypothetical protein